MSVVTVYVPCDSAALAVGADAVAQCIAQEAAARGLDVHIVRNGSRGLFWLEPLVEVATPAGRVAYGPVAPSDVAGLFDAGLATGGAHPLCHGPTGAIPYLARQQRLTFARMGMTDPRSLADYQAYGGFDGLRNAIAMPPEAIVQTLIDSGLRGRGGAAFPAGIKWKTVAGAQAAHKYIVCNADEGDSGTFSDRMTMEGDPFMLIEGMAIAALAVGATQGYIYVRSEYPHAIATLNAAIALAEGGGFLGSDVLGSGKAFHLQVRKGAGSYVCGEETALLESIEGKRGIVRAKPPLPALAGLFGQPTVINNVITLASVPIILARGAPFYRDFGVGRSHGTLPFQLAGNVKHGGLVETAFGLTLRDLLVDQVADTAVGLFENHVDQLTVIGFRQAFAHELGGVLREAADGGDLGGGPAGGFFHGAEHVQQPRFPGLVAGDIQQQAVVISAVSDDVSAEVENRQAQQTFLNQVQGVEHAPGAAVAIGEWMDGLELVMPNGHAN